MKAEDTAIKHSDAKRGIGVVLVGGRINQTAGRSEIIGNQTSQTRLALGAPGYRRESSELCNRISSYEDADRTDFPAWRGKWCLKVVGG
jgi:hypothetical protein